MTVSRRTAHALVQATWAARDPGAPDVVAALAAALGGADTDAAVFAARLAADPGVPLADLGAPLAAGVAGGGVDVHCVPLAGASEAVKVGEGRRRAGGGARARRRRRPSHGPPLPSQALHARLSALLTFLIDGYSPIDPGEGGWDLLLAIDTGTPEPAPSPARPPTVAGLATLCTLWRYPAASTLRVCQVATLPPAARRGVGRALLDAAYGLADARACVDVTVRGRGGGGAAGERRAHPCGPHPRPPPQFEDPTDEMQTLREKVEAARAARCGWLAAAAAEAAAALAAGGGAKGKAPAAAAPPPPPALTPADAARARAELRVARPQAALAFEALVAATLGPAHPALAAAVRARLAASIDESRLAAGKRLFADPGGGVGFVMCRAPAPAEGGPPTAAAAGAPPPEEDGVAAANAAAVEEATGDRLRTLERVVAGLAV